jgi:neutral ceramidase
MKLLTKFVLTLLILGVCSCNNHICLQYQTISPQISHNKKCFYAGVAQTDITPPPGLPLAGYSTLSSDSKGFRMRLKARAYYLKPAKGKPVAIVQCDLLSGSRILHHSVSEKIARQTDISAAGLVIFGSHTHTGPGNYFASQFYNDHASNRKGFDPQLFAFLTEQISQAIINAFQNSCPARIATGLTHVEFATRNRSLPAYLNNSSINNINDMDRFHAINPNYYMIRIDMQTDNGSFKPAGVISFFSIHPNIRPQNLDCLYSGDILGVAEISLAQSIYRKYQIEHMPIHAIINMTHGDNNPNLHENIPENFLSARQLGQKIAKQALELYQQLSKSLKAECHVAFRARDINLLETNRLNGIQLCRPAIGCPVLGGARGKGSFLQYIPPFAPGWPKKWFTGSCQGEKRKVLGPFHGLLFSKTSYPHQLLAQIIFIDNMILLPLPLEITCEAGKRMSNHVQLVAHQMGLSQVHHVLPCSCANGYWGYVTTIEEYQMQYYEGGHTLYGPNTRKFLSEIHGTLLKDLNHSGSDIDLMSNCSYEMNAYNYYPTFARSHIQFSELRSPAYVSESQASYWKFQLSGPMPSQIKWHQPLIRIAHKVQHSDWEPLTIEKIPVNDQGYDLAFIMLDKNCTDGVTTYEIRWYHPQTNANTLYRFEIMGNKNVPTLYSSVFTGE